MKLFRLCILLTLALLFSGLSYGTTLNIRVTASSDDASVIGSTLTINLADLTNYLGKIAGQNVGMGHGMRFLNVTVPKNATISAAYITYQADADLSSTGGSEKIEAEAVDNSATFTTIGNYTDRARTTANATWALPTMVADSYYNSADFKSVVQEIVDRSGWASGNAMVIFMTNNASTDGTYRGTVSYDSSPTTCPQLHIEYTIPIPLLKSPFLLGN